MQLTLVSLTIFILFAVFISLRPISSNDPSHEFLLNCFLSLGHFGDCDDLLSPYLSKSLSL